MVPPHDLSLSAGQGCSLCPTMATVGRRRRFESTAYALRPTVALRPRAEGRCLCCQRSLVWDRHVWKART
eukprot:352738-Chlamydomonas_euryale.AAC.1